MKYFFAIFFNLCLFICVGQNKRICGTNIETIFVEGQVKKTYATTLSSSDVFFARGICPSAMLPDLEKRKVDSLQVILDAININIRDKEYFYIMDVYSDYSYYLQKLTRFHFNKDGSSGATISGEEYRRFPND